MNKLSKTTVIAGAVAGLLLPQAGQASGSNSLFRLIATDTALDLKAMEGKRVLGKSRELLGHIGKVDEQAKLVELKTPSGAIVSIPIDLLIGDGETLSAPSLSRGDVIAMIEKPGEGLTVYEADVVPKGGAVP